MRVAYTHELSREETGALVQLNDQAHVQDHGHRFTATDWANACGGTHFLREEDDVIVAHASVVPRILEAGARAIWAGYVEAVATLPSLWGRGHGTAVMHAANELIRATYELGALSTGAAGFYLRLGWEPWQGQTFVRTKTGVDRTPEEDGNLMILRTARTSAELRLDDPISCEWREGDAW